jgi:hypothetical protein
MFENIATSNAAKGLFKKEVFRADGKNPTRYEVFAWNVIQNRTQP